MDKPPQGAYEVEKTIRSSTVRRTFGQLLEEVHYRGDKIVVQRRGRPITVLVPVELYENWQKQREQFFDLITAARQRSQDVDSDVLEAEIEQAVRDVREEKRSR